MHVNGFIIVFFFTFSSFNVCLLSRINVFKRVHLQSWTAALYNLGSGSWLALTVVPRRKL